MSDREDFLQSVCSEIKYCGIHKEVREELASHIEEIADNYRAAGYGEDKSMGIALTAMGKPKEIGKEFNKQHKMPFNSRNGLFWWAVLATAVIYFVMLPVTSMIYSSGIVLITYAAFGLINCLILKRGKLKVCSHDVKQITLGFATGAIVSVFVLMMWSVFGKVGYYPYCDNVEILFSRAEYRGESVTFYFRELLIWCVCVGMYFLSVPIKKSKGFYFAKPINGAFNATYIRADGESYDYIFNDTNGGKIE